MAWWAQNNGRWSRRFREAKESREQKEMNVSSNGQLQDVAENMKGKTRISESRHRSRKGKVPG